MGSRGGCQPHPFLSLSLSKKNIYIFLKRVTHVAFLLGLPW